MVMEGSSLLGPYAVSRGPRNLLWLLAWRQYNTYDLTRHNISEGLDFWARSQNWEKRLLVSSSLSVYLYAWKNWFIFNFHEILHLRIFRKSLDKIQVSSDKNNEHFTFMTTPRRILLKMRIIADKIIEKVKTEILLSKYIYIYIFKSYRLWDNVERPGGAGPATHYNTTRRMCITCWETKATNTHSEYVIRIAFPLQQWLRERASVLR